MLVVTLFALTIFSITTTQAQELSEFNIFAGLSAPQGDFADDSGADAGYASIGFGAMGEYVYPVGSPGLGWATSAALLVHGAEDEFIAQGADVGRYFVLPLLTGLRYRGEISPTLDAYGIGQAGLTISRSPSGDVDNLEVSSATATSFGFALGGGIILNDRINITVRYLILGDQEYEIDVEQGNQTGEVDYETTINALQVMIGIPIGG